MPVIAPEQLADTQRAFDSVAPDYDGPRGNNDLIQRMRETMWRTLAATVPAGGRLLDLGCGTGLDAVELARRGHRVVATDWSPLMVERTRERAAAAGLVEQVDARHVGIHELERLAGEQFDGIYSNFGPLNCAPDMAATARACAALLRPGGTLVCSVIGRYCPWELAYYTLRGRHERARVRFRRDVVPVGMNGHTIWSRYYSPREFAHTCAPALQLRRYQALSLFLPPPYLQHIVRRYPWLMALLGRLDDTIGGAPLLRDAGDHFLMTLERVG